ncbi:unnamed protein product [Dicrocoelium dendriticum]|nr:unnamed protein product [Dicrocoelium dendriticum]
MSSSAKYLHSRSSSKSRSFYALPDNMSTASQIIRESREWLQAVSTQRPITPLTHARSLFGQPFCNDILSRPLSAIKQSGTNSDQLDSTNSLICPTQKPQEARKITQNRNESMQQTSAGAPIDVGPHILHASNKSTRTKISSGSNAKQRQVKADLLTDRPEFHLQGRNVKLLTPAWPKITSPNPPCNLQQETPTRDLRSELNCSGYKLVAETPFLARSNRHRGMTGSFQASMRSELQRNETRSNETAVWPKPAVNRVLSPTGGRTSSSAGSSFPLLPMLKPNIPVNGLDLHSGLDVPLQRPATDSGYRCSTASVSMKENESVKVDWTGATRKIRSGCFAGKRASVPGVGMPSSQANSSELGDSGLSSWTELDYLVSEIMELSNIILPSCVHRDDKSEVSPADGLRSFDTCSLLPHASKAGDVTEPTEDEIVQLVDRLSASLQCGGLENKSDWPQRPLLLQALLTLMDNTSARLQLALIRAILMIGVSDSKLAEVCKVLYKVAKNPSNDDIFVQDPEKFGIFSIALQCTQLSANATTTGSLDGLEAQHEALLFLCGALKFLFTSPTVGALLNCEPLLSAILRVHQDAEKWLRSQHSENTEGSLFNDSRRNQVERFYGIMFQISEIFCHFSTRKEPRSQFFTSEGVMDHIIDCLLYRLNSRGVKDAPSTAIGIPSPKSAQYLVLFNWIRLLACLTESAAICRRLTGCYDMLSPTSDDKGFCNPAEAHGRIQELCKAMMTVCDLFPAEQMVSFVSKHVSSSQVYACLYTLPAEGSQCKSGELLHNSLAGLNNVTYYINAESPRVVATRQYAIAEVLLGSVLPGNTNPDIILGCIRVFGNLSRQASVRNWLLYNGGKTLLEAMNTPPSTHADERKVEIDEEYTFLHFITQFLDAARPELVYSTLGVLINLMADDEQRPIFRKLGGPAKLLNVLRDFAGYDWQLAGLACKTVWNYTETQEESIQQLIPGETLDELYIYLSEFTDEAVVSRLHHSIIAETNAEADSVELWQTVWYSEFLPVARELLYRIAHT